MIVNTVTWDKTIKVNKERACALLSYLKILHFHFLISAINSYYIGRY